MATVSPVERRAQQVLAGRQIERGEALALLEASEANPWPLIFAADRIRRRFRGRRVRLCSIVPVRLGRCSEDCHWCAQSAHWDTGIEVRGLLPTGEIARLARTAAAQGAESFGLVSSGDRLTEDDLAAVEEAARAVRSETGLDVCGSFGALEPDVARRLVDAGFRRYNHNLETSARHFPRVCSTHTYEDRVRSARAAIEAGLELCCGGIFGIGENDEDRVDLALAIRETGAHVVPLNFLYPVPGTPLGDAKPLPPLKILSIIAMFRFVMPDRTIKVAGGREQNLRDLQSLMFLAGGDACLIGNYLTTQGRPADEDLAMIRDLGLEPGRAGGSSGPGTSHA